MDDVTATSMTENPSVLVVKSERTDLFNLTQTYITPSYLISEHLKPPGKVSLIKQEDMVDNLDAAPNIKINNFTAMYVPTEKMGDNRTMNTNTNVSNVKLLKVKSEAIEVFSLTQSHYTSSECMNVDSETLIGKYRNEQLFLENKIIIKDENVVSVENSTSISNRSGNLNGLSGNKDNANEENDTSGNNLRKSNSHRCDTCMKSFKTRRTLLNHIKCHINVRNHKCDLCTKSFKMRRYLLEHMQYHKDERKHKCDFCTKSFNTRGNMQEHMKSHTDERNHSCDLCAKRFKMRHTMMIHMKSHSDERNYKCYICAKSFKTRYSVAKHIQCHSDEKSHKCDVCTKSFKTRDAAMKHMKCHNDERNHKCGVCTKDFKTRIDVVVHMKCHTDERKHKCNICDKRFKRKYNMVEHMKSHTDEKNHKCNVCAKSFKTRNTMMIHTKCHTNERIHKCDICTRTFKWKSTLVEHAKSHVVETKHKCDVCFMNFKTNRALLSHKSHPGGENYIYHISAGSFKTEHITLNHTKVSAIEYFEKCKIDFENKETRQSSVNQILDCDNNYGKNDWFEKLSIKDECTVNVKEDLEIGIAKEKMASSTMTPTMYNGVLLEVKPEPTEIIHSTPTDHTSLQCSNLKSENCTVCEYQNEPP